MKNCLALKAITVNWAPSILPHVLLEHIQMAPNWKRLETVLIADRDITVTIQGLLLQMLNVMQGIIAPRVKMSAIHSAVLLESIVPREVQNPRTVLQGLLLKMHSHLCVLNVLKVSTVFQNLLFQVCVITRKF